MKSYLKTLFKCLYRSVLGVLVFAMVVGFIDYGTSWEWWFVERVVYVSLIFGLPIGLLLSIPVSIEKKYPTPKEFWASLDDLPKDVAEGIFKHLRPQVREHEFSTPEYQFFIKVREVRE